jgi:hypothetical protein
MNSLLGRFRLLAAAMCGTALLLSACNAVEDVREEPSTPVPASKEVIQGTITGLGYRRPLVLEDIGAKRCTDLSNTTGPKIYCRLNFFGNFNEPVSHFTFGSVDLGTPYNLTIRTQPYGKICSFNTPSQAQGTVTAGVKLDIQMTCVTDTAIARYCVGGTIPQAVRDLPGLRITLSTEEGLKVLSDDPTAGANGPLPPVSQACWFPNAIYNSASSLPILRWYVTAAYKDSTGRLNNCRVTGGAANTGSNDLGENTNTSLGDVTNVSIAACDFSIGGNVGYTQTPGSTAAQTISGLTLKLKAISGDWARDTANVEVPPYVIPAVTVASPGTATTPFTIGGTVAPARFLSNPDALYDVQITNQPTGQFCIVGATGITIPITAAGTPYPAGGSVTIGAGAQLANVNLPLTNGIQNALTYSWTTYSDLSNLAVRCRALPGTTANPSGVLTGTYQMTITATVGANAPVTTRARNFLTFFDDGSYLYGSRSINTGATTATGVERGFYYYNVAAGTITFTVLTDTNNSYAVNAPPLTATQQGISALPALTLANVVKTPGARSRITAFAGTTGTGASITNTSWQLDEPSAVAGEIEGTWTTGILPGGAQPDHRRVFIYNGSTTFGSQISAIGAAVNYGDACYFLYQLDNEPNVSTQEGYYARRGTSANNTGNTTGGSEASTGCPIGSTTPAATAATLDYYQPVPIQRLLLSYPWRLPGSNSGFDGRSPSPIFFRIVPGSGTTPDKITITASDQGVLQPATTVTFEKTKAN